MIVFLTSGLHWGTDGSILVLSIIIGIFANLIFRYVSSIVQDALATVFVCYAVAKDNSLEQVQTAELERLIPIVVTDIVMAKQGEALA